MSYRKYINNYLIEFKDEESYLEARLENLELYSYLPFMSFIQNEMYDKSKCEVERIVRLGTEETEETDIKYNTSPLEPDEIADPVSTYNFPINGDTSANNSMWVYSDDVIVSGNITYTGGIDSGVSDDHAIYYWNSQLHIGDNSNTPEEPKESKELKKPEEPIDPIDSRFDILDL